MTSIKKYFFMGLAFILPLVVIFYFSFFLYTIIDGVVHYIPLPEYLHNVPMISFLVFGLLVISSGYFFSTVLGAVFMKWIDRVIGKVPLIRSLFNLTKQAMLSIFSENRDHFRHVVLVEYPSANIWSLGFVSRMVKYSIENYVDVDNTVAVFIPTSPNPSSGFLIFVSIKKLHILDMTPTDAINIIVSAGIYCPSSKFTSNYLLSDHQSLKIKKSSVTAPSSPLSDINSTSQSEKSASQSENPLASKSRKTTVGKSEKSKTTGRRV